MLTDQDRAVLDFEARGWIREGVKLGAMGLELDLRPTAYYMRLNRLLDDPAAEEYAPILVRRLRRVRDRARVRSAR